MAFQKFVCLFRQSEKSVQFTYCMCKKKEESEPRFPGGRSDVRERTLPHQACGKNSWSLCRAKLCNMTCAIRRKKASEAVAWVGMGRKNGVGGMGVCLSFK